MEALRGVLLALNSVLAVMQIVIVIRVFIEFKAVRRDAQPIRLLLQISEPLLAPVRKLLNAGNKDRQRRFDLSPLVVILILYLLRQLIRRTLGY